MSEEAEQLKMAIELVDSQHRDRARALSEMVSKMMVNRQKGGLPKTFEEYLKDLDVIQRCAQHVGACQALNEMQYALDPDVVTADVPKLPLTS